MIGRHDLLDRVDDGVGTSNGAGDRGLVTHIRAEDRGPYCDPHSRSLGDETPHETPAEEPRAAKHADRGHGIASCVPGKVDPYSQKR
jgi:hypothetical protein